MSSLENVDSIKVTLSGTDAEYWAGNYGAVFQDMDLYLSGKPVATMLASKSASTSAEGSDYLVAGLGATAALVGVAAFAINKLKAKAVQNGAFQ